MRALGPCEGGTGKETAEFKAGPPERDDLYALAFDPAPPGARTAPGRALRRRPGPVPNSVGTGEPGQSSLGYVFAPPPLAEAPPVIEVGVGLRQSATSAGLHARIDPKGFATRYAFQYPTEAAYEEPPEKLRRRRRSAARRRGPGRHTGRSERDRDRRAAWCPTPPTATGSSPSSNARPKNRPGSASSEARQSSSAPTRSGGPGPSRPPRLGARLPGAEERRPGLPADPTITSCLGNASPPAPSLLGLPDAEQRRGAKRSPMRATPFSPDSEGASDRKLLHLPPRPRAAGRPRRSSPPLLQNSTSRATSLRPRRSARR